MAVGMNSNMTAAALLILCTSIRERGNVAEIRNGNAGLELETGISIPPKTMRWEELPDLEFKSDSGTILTRTTREDVVVNIRSGQGHDDAILPVGASTPRRSMIGLGIRRSMNWLSQRNSKSSSTKSLRVSHDGSEIWGISEALSVGKSLPPLPDNTRS
jgi:hypothetical protein